MDERLLNVACTVTTVTAGTADVYGDATESTSTSSTMCHLRQLKTSEVEGDAVEVTRWRVYLPGSVSLAGADRLTIAGASYSLVGDPYPVRRPTTGLVDHLEAVVERVQ